MTTDSNVRLSAPSKIMNRITVSSLRAPGLFAQWPLLGIMMLMLGTLVFGALAYQVKVNESFVQWDMTATKAWQAALQRIPTSLVEYVIFGFYVGRELILLGATILGIYFWRKHFWRELMMVLWGPGLGGLLWFVLSRYLDRPRPSTQLDVLLIDGPSFPSGHAMSAVLFYGLLAYLLVPRMPSRFWKWFVVILLTLVTASVGPSRLLVGGHYVSDVIAGYAIGVAWAGLVYTLAERFVPVEQNTNVSMDEKIRPDGEFHVLRTPGMFKKWPLFGVILILLGSLSFAAMGYSWFTRSPLVQLDQSIYEELITASKAAPSPVNQIMIFGFFMGKQVILLMVTLLSIYFAYHRFWREFAMLLISSAGGSFVWDYFVNYFDRPRPADQTGLAVTSIPSFPSGHAMSAIICYGFLTYLLIPKMPTRFWKWTLAIVVLLVILFGGFSRIFQGSHYLTDVLAGYALGLAWAALVYTLIENIFLRKKV